jgi:hypothetical protein
MKNENYGVNTQGVENTVVLTNVLTQLTSSFDEYSKRYDSYTDEIKKVISLIGLSEQPMKTKGSKKTENQKKRFGKLKNEILIQQIENCESVEYDSEKHITVKELGYKSIYELDKRSKELWKKYFEVGKVYLRKGKETKMISRIILFDKSINEYLGKTVSNTNSETETK